MDSEPCGHPESTAPSPVSLSSKSFSQDIFLISKQLRISAQMHRALLGWAICGHRRSAWPLSVAHAWFPLDAGRARPTLDSSIGGGGGVTLAQETQICSSRCLHSPVGSGVRREGASGRRRTERAATVMRRWNSVHGSQLTRSTPIAPVIIIQGMALLWSTVRPE